MSTERRIQSDTVAEIFKALNKVQAKLKPVIKTAENPFFKSHYADHSAVVTAAQELLAANGLCVVQTMITGENGDIELVTTLGHVSGEYLRSYYPVRSQKGDPQSLGSAITYARRYTFSAVVGITTADDDDGNAASAQKNGTGVHDSLTPAQQATFTPKSVKGAAQFVSAPATTVRPPSDKQKQFLLSLMESHNLAESLAGEVVHRLSGYPEFTSKNVSMAIEQLKMGEELPEILADLSPDYVPPEMI